MNQILNPESPLFAQSFGQWVRQRRKQRNLTQKGLGRLIDYAEITVRQIESDSYSLTRFVVERLIASLADTHEDRAAILHFALKLPHSSAGQNSGVYAPGTPFYGRSGELDYLITLLNARESRCISIVGVGGVGKTRLALRALEILHPMASLETRFVNLTEVETPDLLPSVTLGALGIPLNPITPVLEQLIQTLQSSQPREMLIVFDNFEQLLPDGIVFIQALLERTIHVKLLLTSRERLSLRNEWCIRLDGLEISPSGATVPEAVALFVSTAQRINQRFVASDSRVIGVILEICQKLQGIPLAIEMAASWTEVHSCEQILASISEQMLELATRQREIDPRHKTLRAVFESTWADLSLAEQSTLKRLAVFRGGFSIDAASAVAEVTPEVLAFLQDKMLIQTQANGRLVLHEMIRQLALQKLSSDADERLQARIRHGKYFVQFMVNSAQNLKYYHSNAEVARLTPDYDNLREMWHLMCERREIDWFNQIWECLWVLFNVTSRYNEGEQFFRLVLAQISVQGATETERHIRGRSQILCSLFVFRQGQIPEACNLLFSSDLEFIRTNGTDEELLWINLADSYLYHARGDGPASLTSALYALRRLEKISEDPYLFASLYFQLGRTEHLLGNTMNAYNYLSESIRWCRDAGIHWGTALILAELGLVAEAQQKFTEALDCYRTLITPRASVEDVWNYQRVLICVGRLKLVLGYISEAVDIQKGTLQANIENPFLGFQIDCFVEIALILKHFDDTPLAVVLLQYCAVHQECFQPTRDRAAQYLTAIQTELPDLDISTAQNLLPKDKMEVAVLLANRLGNLPIALEAE